MRSVIAAVALAQDSRMLFSPGMMPATSSQVQVAQVAPGVYDEMPLQIAQPVAYAQPEPVVYVQNDAADFSWLLPSIAVLAVGAAAGAYAAGAGRAAEEELLDEDFEEDLEAALDEEAEVLELAGPLVTPYASYGNKVAMLFSSGKKAAPKGKAAPKKAPVKKAAPKKAPVKKAAPKPKAKPAAKKSNIQPSSSAIPFLRDLFSLSAVGGAKGLK